MNFSCDDDDEGLHSKTFSRSHKAWTSSSAAHKASRFAVPLGAAFPWRERLDICGVGSAMIAVAVAVVLPTSHKNEDSTRRRAVKRCRPDR